MTVSEITIRKIGNSFGLILTKDILKAMRASLPGTKIYVSVDDEGTATMKAVEKGSPFKGPLAGLAKYASLWNDEDKSAIETAEDLKAGRNNKTLDVW